MRKGLLRASSGALVLGATLLLSGASCTDASVGPLGVEAGDSPPHRGGELHLATFGDIRTLDPAGPTDGISAQPIELLFAGLVDFAPTGEVVPDAAESFELQDGGRTLRFSIRQGVRFHDGEELTAADVQRSVERALRPDTPNAFASFFDNLLGFHEFQAGRAAHLEGVSVGGRYDVSFRLQKPDATFLSLLALPALRPVCKSGGDAYDPAWHPCGAGPFRVPEGGWEKGRSLRIVRHDGYFRAGLPYLDAVSWAFGMGLSTQRFKFERGDLDIRGDLSFGDGIHFKSDPRWAPLTWLEPATTLWGEGMNVEMPPFDNVEVRRAVASAIDRSQYRLCNAVAITPETRSLPSGVPFYDPAMRHQIYDLDEALEHMRRAGYPYDPRSASGGIEAVLDYPVYKPGMSFSTGSILQQALAKIGIRLRLKVVSYATYLSLIAQRKRIAIAPMGWSADYPDASDFFESLFASKAIAEDGGSNNAFFHDDKFDALVERAHGELDRAERQRLYREANDLLVDQAPWAFTFSYRYMNVKQGYVRGRLEHAVLTRQVTEVWLDKGRAAGPLGRAPLGAPERFARRAGE